MKREFIPNDDSPDLYRNYTLSFPGGSVTATKDVLASIFEKDNLPSTCEPETKTVSRRESFWTPYPGATEFKRVQAYTYELKNWSNGGNSRASAGEPIKFLINGDFWSARLVGSHQAFMDYLCTNKSSLVDGFTYWQSQKGSPYMMTDDSTSS